MWEYMKRHERFVREQLEGGEVADWRSLKRAHEKQIRYMQHERLVHLLVTLFVCLFFLLTTGFATVRPTLAAGTLAALLLALTGAYVLHYFRLENGVQRWYRLSDRLDQKLAGAPSEE